MPPPATDVFICYRRSDGQLAARFFRDWLSRYRLPNGFTASSATRAPSKTNPLRIFVDEDSEGTTHDYWDEHIRRVLDGAMKVLLLWTPAASRRRESWDPMWAEIEHLVQAARAKDIILVRLGVDPGSPSPGDILKQFPRMEYRTPFGDLPHGPPWRLRWTANDQELARIAAGVCGVSSSLVPLFLGLDAHRGRVRLRARATMSAAIIGLVATGLSFWLLGFHPRLYAHYRVLSREVTWQEHSSDGSSRPSLGELMGEYYAEFWVQSFEKGMVVHPTQLEQAFSRSLLPDHTRSIFILLRGSSATSARWFYQRRPPVPEPPRDREEFLVWLEAMPKRDSALAEDDWPRSEGQTPGAIADEYSPHGGTISISGGIAIAYASYRLDRYLGPPVSPERACTGILRIHRGGYRMLIVDLPDRPDSSQAAFISLATDRIRETPASAYGVGHSYAWGEWTSEEIRLGPIERRLRPLMPQPLSMVSIR